MASLRVFPAPWESLCLDLPLYSHVVPGTSPGVGWVLQVTVVQLRATRRNRSEVTGHGWALGNSASSLVSQASPSALEIGKFGIHGCSTPSALAFPMHDWGLLIMLSQKNIPQLPIFVR